jgi:hypothetical protein
MDIGSAFAIFLVLLALVVVRLVWYWWTRPTFFAPRPCPYCDRDAEEAEWQGRYCEEAFQTADALLLLLCDAFSLNPEDRYRFGPDDRIIEAATLQRRSGREPTVWKSRH